MDGVCVSVCSVFWTIWQNDVFHVLCCFRGHSLEGIKMNFSAKKVNPMVHSSSPVQWLLTKTEVYHYIPEGMLKYCYSCGYYSVKTFGLVQTIFWSSQLHACCVRDTLQNFKRDASYLNQNEIGNPNIFTVYNIKLGHNSSILSIFAQHCRAFAYKWGVGDTTTAFGLSHEEYQYVTKSLGGARQKWCKKSQNNNNTTSNTRTLETSTCIWSNQVSGHVLSQPHARRQRMTLHPQSLQLEQ